MPFDLTAARRRSRRFLHASACAVVLAVVGHHTSKLLALNFAIGVEGEIWQQLTAWGHGIDSSCVSSYGIGTMCPPQTPIAPAPPAQGELLYPIGIASDGGNVYVSDQGNNRIQGFDASGTPITFAYPMGDGLAGVGQVNAPGGAYERLNQPEGITTDADPSGHKLVVSDSFNSRLAVFHPNGQLAFAATVADTVSAVPQPSAPTGVAVTPGTIVYDPQHVPLGADTSGRIVVTDKYNNYVYIFDSAFTLLHQLGTGSQEFDDALHPNNEAAGFASPSGVSIDDAGHVFIADYDNQRIVVYDLNGHFLGKFGQPPDRFSVPDGTLLGPYGVSIDRSTPPQHHGRVVVADGDNQRVLFYLVSFVPDPAHPGQDKLSAASYQFFIDAAGNLNGYPQTAVLDMSQDPAGRLYVVDTVNFRVQQFQLPDLAVVQGSATGGSGSFSVVVPIGKDASGVSSIQPYIDPVTHVFDCPPNLLGGACPRHTQNVATVSNITPTSVATLGPGEIATFTFDYTVVDPSQPVVITVGAVGDPNPTTHVVPSSNAVAIVPTKTCTDCVTTRQIIDTVTNAPAVSNGSWYPHPIVIRLTASSASGQLASLSYGFTSGPLLAEIGFFTKAVGALGGDGFGATIDVPVVKEAAISSFDDWSTAADGSSEGHHPTTIGLDFVSPSIRFRFDQRPPMVSLPGVDPVTGQPIIERWFTGVTPATPLRVPVEFADAVSGLSTVAPSASADGHSYVVFTGEGRDQVRSASATDTAGHTTTGSSGDSLYGGYLVSVDNTPPRLLLPNNLTLSTAGAALAQVPVATPFQASATDFLADGVTLGSGVQSLTNPFPALGFHGGITWYAFSAVDQLGNRSLGTRAVSVNITQPSTGTGGAVVAYAAAALNSTPAVSCSPLSGTQFPIGVTTVTCTATDASAGLADTRSFTVTVTGEPTKPPAIRVAVSPRVLWPANHKMVTVTATVRATSETGRAPVVKLVSISSNEPDGGLGDGDTPNDIQGAAFGTGDRVFQLRAERYGKRLGRTYTIKYSATASGAVAYATAYVFVPPDMSGVFGKDEDNDDRDRQGDDHAAGDNCHGSKSHGHHDGDGCLAGHHGHYAGDGCKGKSGFHHDGDGDEHKS